MLFGCNKAKLVNGQLVFDAPNTQYSTLQLEGNGNIVQWLYEGNRPFRYPLFSSCMKVFRKQIIDDHNIRYRTDLSLGEDQVFVCEYLKHVQSMFYDSAPYYSFIPWTAKERPYGLGGMMRTAEDFLYNQTANYQALISLYEATGVTNVKDYAVNYILDRPVTRILFRNVQIKNRGWMKYNELKTVTTTRIYDILKKEADNVYLVKNKNVAMYDKLILKSYPFVMIYCMAYLQVNCIDPALMKCGRLKKRLLGINSK